MHNSEYTFVFEVVGCRNMHRYLRARFCLLCIISKKPWFSKTSRGRCGVFPCLRYLWLPSSDCQKHQRCCSSSPGTQFWNYTWIDQHYRYGWFWGFTYIIYALLFYFLFFYIITEHSVCAKTPSLNFEWAAHAHTYTRTLSEKAIHNIS